MKPFHWIKENPIKAAIDSESSVWSHCLVKKCKKQEPSLAPAPAMAASLPTLTAGAFSCYEKRTAAAV